MTRDIIKILLVALLVILGGLTTCVVLCPAEWHPVKLQGVDCTMKKIKDPSLMPKLRDQEAAVKVEAMKQTNGSLIVEPRECEKW